MADKSWIERPCRAACQVLGNENNNSGVINPMQEPFDQPNAQSDAKRQLLDKCLRGEFDLAGAGDMQTREARRQPGSLYDCKGPEVETAQKPDASIRSSTSASPKAQPSANAKSNRKSVARHAFNRFLHLLCRFGPGGATLRPLFHRMRGVAVGKNVWIGDEVYLDNEFPECVEIEDGAMIELRSTILAHTHGAGRVVVGKNAFIGAGAVIVTSANRTLVIGEGSVIMASSLVTGSVAPYTLYGSDASKPLARITKPFTGDTTYEEFITTLRPLSG
jgi:acetyltransferase-like isoleucine patch superfamily enzyme